MWFHTVEEYYKYKIIIRLSDGELLIILLVDQVGVEVRELLLRANKEMKSMSSHEMV